MQLGACRKTLHLDLRIRVVDGESDYTAEHKDDKRGDLCPDQRSDEQGGEGQVEPVHAGTLERFVGLGVRFDAGHSGAHIAEIDALGGKTLLLGVGKVQRQDARSDKAEHLHGDQTVPQRIGVAFDGGGCADGGAAPRHHVHDAG